jgi:hypothetical protein
MEVPSHLSDPSWIEENRAVRALWLLAIRCRGSGSFSPDGQSSAEEWTCAVLPWMDDETAEVETSLTHGSTLLPPGSTSGQARSLPDIPRPYPIPQPPYRRNVPTLPPPRFPQSSRSSRRAASVLVLNGSHTACKILRGTEGRRRRRLDREKESVMYGRCSWWLSFH